MKADSMILLMLRRLLLFCAARLHVDKEPCLAQESRRLLSQRYAGCSKVVWIIIYLFAALPADCFKSKLSPVGFNAFTMFGFVAGSAGAVDLKEADNA